jgi:hypothetical protein
MGDSAPEEQLSRIARCGDLQGCEERIPDFIDLSFSEDK